MTQSSRASSRLRPRSRPPPRNSAPHSEREEALGDRSAVSRAPELLQSLQERRTSAATSHALLPLLRRLAALVARPGRLVAALLEPEELPSDYEALAARAVAFQRRELQGQAAGWQVIGGAVASNQEAGGGVDGVMVKAALYYWRVWELVSAMCVEAVARTQRAVAGGAGKRRRESSPPSSEDGMSPGGKRPRLTRASNEFLIGWFLAHKASPYPSAGERVQIAARTGLSEQQVRNWFANMRKRHWKPTRPGGKKPRCLLDYVLRQPEPSPAASSSL